MAGLTVSPGVLAATGAGGAPARTMPNFSAAGTGADAANDGLDLVLTVPGTTGELLLLAWGMRVAGTWDNKATVNSNGWNDIFVAVTNGTNTLRTWMLWKLHDGTEPNVTITYTGAGMSGGIIHSYANADPADPIDDVATEVSVTGSPGSIAMPSVDTTFDNGLAVTVILQTDDTAMAAATGETGGDWVESVAEFLTPTGTDIGIQFQHAQMATAGTISGGTSAFTAPSAIALGISINGAP